MNILELNKARKLLLTTTDLASLLSITKESAKVTASRYVKKGFLVRLKKDVYILENKFENLTEQQLFFIANIIQTPSYISLSTALSFYNITTQQQRDFIESIALKRTKNVSVKSVDFFYSTVKEEFYNGFERNNNFFIALPEKAFADAVYLASLNRYNIDLPSINFSKVDKKKVNKFLLNTNKKTKFFWDNICRTYKI